MNFETHFTNPHCLTCTIHKKIDDLNLQRMFVWYFYGWHFLMGNLKYWLCILRICYLILSLFLMLYLRLPVASFLTLSRCGNFHAYQLYTVRSDVFLITLEQHLKRQQVVHYSCRTALILWLFVSAPQAVNTQSFQ